MDQNEARLLRVARDLVALARAGRPPDETLGTALARLSALAGEAQPGRDAGRDATRVLALAWAREQVRLAVGELLDRVGPSARVRRDVPTDTLAWLVVAACEALAREPAEAVPDRLTALTAFIRPGGSSP